MPVAADTNLNSNLAARSYSCGINFAKHWACQICSYQVLSEVSQRLTTVILNLIVIQHQSFDVSNMYSHSLRVPLMAGPFEAWPFFCSGVRLDAMPMFGKVFVRL
jgi:hypothetical protein